MIKFLSYSAKTIYSFLTGLKNGLNVLQSYTSITCLFSITTAYRYYHRLKKKLADIRDTLVSISKPPESLNNNSALSETLLHLVSVFPDAYYCPITSYQFNTQKNFF